jgi:predicted esterase
MEKCGDLIQCKISFLINKKNCWRGRKQWQPTDNQAIAVVASSPTTSLNSNTFRMKHLTLKIESTANYYTLGEPSPNVKQLWIVCHGYAQTADEFLTNFKDLDDGTRLIVAPEGLNNFYRRGFQGDVVSLWMTKRHRASQIEDYCNYLQKLYDHFIPMLSKEVRIVILGFSQGTATVSRWVMEKTPHFNDLLLWAGLPPEDLDYRSKKDYLANKNLFLLYGTTDNFLTESHYALVGKIEKDNQIDFDEQKYIGGHEIPKQVLLDFVKREMIDN